MRENREQQELKRTRVPVHEATNNAFSVLNQDKAYQYRTVDEFEGNQYVLDTYINAGYEFVTLSAGKELGLSKYCDGKMADAGDRVCMGNGSNGKMFLMRIKKEFYKQDQKEKQKHQDEIMSSIYKSTGGLPPPEIKLSMGTYNKDDKEE